MARILRPKATARDLNAASSNFFVVGLVAKLFTRGFEGVVDDRLVRGQGRGGGDEGRVGGRVSGFELLDRVDVASVGDDDGHGLELFQ